MAHDSTANGTSGDQAPSPDRSPSVGPAVAVLAVLAAAAAVALGWASPHGLGLSPDSAVYLSAARNVTEGQGLTAPAPQAPDAPLTHYPPLYPLSVAVLRLAGLDTLSAARWLHVGLLGLNTFLFGWLIQRHTGSTWASALAACVFALSYSLLRVHAFAWSEPTFLACLLGGWLALSYACNGGRVGWLLAASALTAKAVLARYVGVVQAGTALLAVLLLWPGSWRRRALAAATAVSLPALALAAWMLRNRLLTDTATNRPLGFHPPGRAYFGMAWATLKGWFTYPVPAELPWTEIRVLAFLALLAAAGLLWARWRRATDRPARPAEASGKSPPSRPAGAPAARLDARPLAAVLAIFAVAYALFHLLAVTVFDAHAKPDTRQMMPLYVALLALVALAVTAAAWRAPLRWPRTVLATLAAVVVLTLAAGGYSWLSLVRQHGMGYNSRTWRHSQTLSRVRDLPPDRLIYTNGQDVLALLAGRDTYALPRHTDVVAGQLNPDFRPQCQQMIDRLRRDDGLLVYLLPLAWRSYLPSIETVAQMYPWPAHEFYDDGVILYTAVPAHAQPATAPAESAAGSTRPAARR